MTLRWTSPQAAMVVSSASIDAGDGGLEVALEHAVELEALAGGDAEGAVGVLVGDPLEREVLLAGDRAGGDRDPHHEAVRLLQAGGLERAAGVAVVLLVGAVELEQRDVVVGRSASARTPASRRWCRAGAGPWRLATSTLDSGCPVIAASRLSCEVSGAVEVQPALRLVGAGPAAGCGCSRAGPRRAPARVQWVQPSVG